MSTSVAANPRATLMDVAKLAGVSRQVAGRVLNGTQGNNSRASGTTIRRILEVAESLRYRPNLAAMKLRGRRAHLYGVLVASAGDPLRGMLVQQLDVEAARHGCQTMIANTTLVQGVPYPNRFTDRVSEFAHRGVDGILCAVHEWINCDRQALVAAHPNTVFYDEAGLAGAPCVIPDRGAAARLAVRHLAARGRQRIALATLSKSIPSHVDRVDGYRKELAAQGLPYDPRLAYVAESHGLRFDDLGSDTSLDMPSKLADLLVEKLIVNGKADAIVCHDDFLAANLLGRMRSRGISVGPAARSVSIVGYLNHSLSAFTDPPLTTIDPQYDIAATHMVAMLERMIQGDPLPAAERVVRIEPTLIERESA